MMPSLRVMAQRRRSRTALYLCRLARSGHGTGAERRGRRAIALVALFLPGFLILIGALPFWDQLRRKTWRSRMQGANAAVVRNLGAALYSPCLHQRDRACRISHWP